MSSIGNNMIEQYEKAVLEWFMAVYPPITSMVYAEREDVLESMVGGLGVSPFFYFFPPHYSFFYYSPHRNYYRCCNYPFGFSIPSSLYSHRLITYH